MADDSPAKGKLVPAVLELVALALVLGAEEAWRADKSWHQWIPEGIAGLFCQAGVFVWSRVVSVVQERNPWMQLKRANMQIQKLSRQYALNLADAIANEVKWTPKLGQFLAVA